MRRIITFLYLVALKAKEFLYKKAVLPKNTLPCKVISVGNITAGGTGKTPVVAYIAKLLTGKKRTAILTRGYKRKNKAEVLDVAAGADPVQCGDEAVLLADTTGLPVIAAVNRLKGGQYAVQKYNSEVCILDDGFQRRFSLARDLEIVVIDASNPFGNGKLLPIGILREKTETLSAAEVIILTKTDEAVNIEELRETVKTLSSHALLLESIYEPVELYNVFDKKDKVALSFVRGKKITALSGVGNPKYFIKVLSGLNPAEIHDLPYPDHYAYDEADVFDINRRAAESELIITTEKDGVKLGRFSKEKFNCRLYALKVSLKILKGEEDFKEKVGAV
jgi:tetraacyldisaccharide 4'-kinase